MSTLTIDTPVEPPTVEPVANRKLADEVRNARKSKRWTQAELSRQTGLSISTVTRIERGTEVDAESEAIVRHTLGIPLTGRTLTALARAPFTADEEAGKPSAMGQLVGQMMMHGGAGGVDPYGALLEAATLRDEPPEVFKALARARKEAPPTADWAWWLTQYLDAAKRGRGDGD